MCIICIFGINHSVFAEAKIQSISIKTPFRFDHQKLNETGQVKTSRYQLQVSTDLVMSLTGTKDQGLQVITLIGSGDSFTSQWSTLYDQESDLQRPLELSVRQLYLHYLGKYGRFSFGVIPPVKEFVSNTSMDSDGWIRGARVVIYVGDHGELEGVTGAVDHLKQPSVFQVPSKWNYHEIEWTQHWLDHFRSELGTMFLRKANIVRGELRYRLMACAGAQCELSAELLRDFKTRRYAYDMMLQVKKNDYRLRLEYSKIDQRFGLLGELVNDYFSLGTVKMVALDGPTYWKKLQWFTRYYYSKTVSRGMLGVSYPLAIIR